MAGSMTWPARVMGVLTVLYSIAVLLRPSIFTKPTTLTGDDVPAPIGILARGIGARDAAVGLAMVFAPAGAALYLALAVRIACDFSDAAIFGVSVRDTKARLKVIGVAAGWGLLTALAWFLAAR